MIADKLRITAALLLLAAGASAQVRTDDIRVKPPESWPKNEIFGLEVRAGGNYLAGNVDAKGISAGLDLNDTFLPKHQIFVQAARDYAEANGTRVLNKAKGSFLYAYKVKPNWNLFANSTHAKNDALKLEYRTTNGAGVCYHSFWPVFDPILLSLAVAPEYERFEDKTHRSLTRAQLRLNFKTAATAHLSVGADLMYMPDLAAASDYRMYDEAYFQLKITDNGLDFRAAVTDEYESRPRPGVKQNDISVNYSVVYKISR